MSRFFVRAPSAVSFSPQNPRPAFASFLTTTIQSAVVLRNRNVRHTHTHKQTITAIWRRRVVGIFTAWHRTYSFLFQFLFQGGIVVALFFSEPPIPLEKKLLNWVVVDSGMERQKRESARERARTLLSGRQLLFFSPQSSFFWIHINRIMICVG